MDQAQIKRVEESFRQLAPRGEELVNRFYTMLFANHPEVRSMFPDDMAEQKRKLLASLVFVVQGLRSPQKLEKPLKDMGVRHAEFGTQPEQYPVVRDTLVAVMSEMKVDGWNTQVERDWFEAIDLVSSIMLVGAHERETAAAH